MIERAGRIVEATTSTESYRYRTPIKFGGAVLDRVTLLNASVSLEVNGRTATGFGSMPMGNVWAWPTRELPYETTVQAMLEVAAEAAQLLRGCGLVGHPVEIVHALEAEFFRIAVAVQARLGLPEPIPKLATLVAVSPFDAALHDAYGKVFGLSAYQTLSRDFLHRDLSHFLGKDYAGRYLDEAVSAWPRPSLPVYHLVGALDPLTRAEVARPVGDGLPETLGDWIAADGLTHLKIKLNGDDLAWDLERTRSVHAVAGDAVSHYSLDFNERCPNVAYLLEFLHRLRDETPIAYARVQYVEQPTKRDLHADRGNAVHAAAELKPIVIDESLLDLETLHLACEMGYSGVAFKACKGQTPTLLLAVAARELGLFRCVQDLTCVGASLIHSAGLAAHIPGVAAIESNGRQYCPAANADWDRRFPGLFTIRGGTMPTGTIVGPGLGTG